MFAPCQALCSVWGTQRWIRHSLCPIRSSRSRGRCAVNVTGAVTELCSSVGSWKLFRAVRWKLSSQDFCGGVIKCGAGGLCWGKTGGPEWQHRSSVIPEAVDTSKGVGARKFQAQICLWGPRTRRHLSLSVFSVSPLTFSVLKVIW